MQNAFEIFIQDEKITTSDWQKFSDKIKEYDKIFCLEIVFDLNQIEFYLFSKKELSKISTKLEGFLLTPVKNHLFSDINRGKRISFKISAKKNILEIKEEEEIKKERLMKSILIHFFELGPVKFYKVEVNFIHRDGDKLYSTYFTFTNPLINFEINFKKNIKLKKKITPPFLKLDETIKLFSQNSKKALLQVFSFPYFNKPFYFPLDNFEFGKHSLIVGQTGVGKSKLIELFVKKLSDYGLTDDYRIVIVDPHASMYSQFLGLNSIINFDFIRTSCDLFPSFSEPKIATELTILLFKTLLKDQFNTKMERVLKYVVFILFLRNQMSLFALKKFLTELEFRKEIMNNIDEEFEYLVHFFDTEFVEMQTKFYDVAIMPILVLIDELNFIPAFSKQSQNQLESVLKENFLTYFSLNRIFLGEKATRLIAGLIIQQLFLIAQKKSLNKKIILIIDEVSLVENESMISILSEARKFDLSLFLSQQYLTQITPELLKAVLSNVYNYFIFKVSDEDGKILTKNLDMKFPDEILNKEKEKGSSEEDLKRQLLITLNPRECLVRAFSRGKFYPCFKARTLPV